MQFYLHRALRIISGEPPTFGTFLKTFKRNRIYRTFHQFLACCATSFCNANCDSVIYYSLRFSQFFYKLQQCTMRTKNPYSLRFSGIPAIYFFLYNISAENSSKTTVRTVLLSSIVISWFTAFGGDSLYRSTFKYTLSHSPKSFG